jgi:hypothetical protein
MGDCYCMRSVGHQGNVNGVGATNQPLVYVAPLSGYWHIVPAGELDELLIQP